MSKIIKGLKDAVRYARETKRDANGRLAVNLPKPRVSNPNFLSEELAAHQASLKNEK